MSNEEKILKRIESIEAMARMFLNEALELRKDMAGFSRPALRKGKSLDKETISRVLSKRLIRIHK